MKLITIILGILCLVSCTKSIEIIPIQPKPILIQIEAVYIDENSDLSPVVLAK